jgi:rhodanese-related sulfurtransferase
VRWFSEGKAGILKCITFANLNRKSPVDFITNNWILITLAVSSGFMLMWPNIAGAASSGVSPQQAVQLMNKEKAVVIDVSKPEEAALARVVGSRNLPLDDLLERLPKTVADKNRPLILVCASGVRAKSAAAVARKAGYTQVNVLSGGLKAWREANLPVEHG